MEEVISVDVEKLLRLKPNEDPPLMPMRAAKIVDRKSLGEILKKLKPLPEHLKRVRHFRDAETLILLSEDEIEVEGFNICNVRVPAVAPLSGEQTSEWSARFWPVAKAFGPAHELVPIFSKEDRDSSLAWMKCAWECSKRGQNGSTGAVIVDPRTNECVAMVHSTSTKLRHAAILAISETANCIQKAKGSTQPSVLGGPETYLCTGFDVFLTHEPCCMCAMALLHSRVRRVFWDFPDPKRGALGSVVRLHTLPNINHRYRVYRGFFPDARDNLCDNDKSGCYAIV